MASSAESIVEPDLIAGRYRITAELGRGGAARVYQVLDQRSGEHVALKKLLNAERGTTLQAMFEREYHTLAQLAHPRIIRVFDYGLDQGDSYYTMELLAGADSRETMRAKVPGVEEACTLLRDAATALALVHSRRMVHRDISPRNLWCTPDGRGKLIDFGTLVAMGPQTRIAGTPPFIAPESVFMQPLDARSDLYSLGALAYYLLTQRNAYPAREISDLRGLWQRPPLRPELLRPDLPGGLCDLVMALLSIDPRGRPASAAEVVERMTAIGQLAQDDERLVAQAFLSSPKLVGRDEQSALLRKRLLRAMRGRGGVAAIVAPAGLGRSRMLESFVLAAKLAGAHVVTLFATAVGSGPFALAATLAERLLEQLPLAAAAAVDVAPVLGHLSSAVHRALGAPTLSELRPHERARKLSAALVTLIERVCRREPLVIAIDDVHRADGASLGVLGRLSVLTNDRPLLLVTSIEAATLSKPPPALEELAREGRRVMLEALDRADTQALLASLFGPVPGLDAAAAWLHELSAGSPQACMQYAQHLVDQGIARYEHGGWRLPLRLRERGLPATLGAMFEARIAALSEDARALALGLALGRDETRSAWQPENHVRIEDFPKLIEGGDVARSFLALDELLRVGMLEQRDSCYVLAQRAMVDALLRVSDEGTRRCAHRRLADIFAAPEYQVRLLRVRQLQQAGESQRARELLIDFTTRLGGGAMDWASMRISSSADCTLRALTDWTRDGGSPREAILLRRQLILICSVYDWSLTRHGADQIARLSSDIGLAHWDQTDTVQPPLARIIECLKSAQQSYDRTPEAERGFAPGEAVRELPACVMPLSGAAVHSHDVALARSTAVVLDPMRPLSPLIELLADACALNLERVRGCEVGTKILSSTDRLMAATELPEVLRLGGAAVNLQIQAVEDARCGRERGLELVERLVPTAGEDLFLVVHARWLGHAFLGRAEQADRFRKQAEVITEDDVWRRKCFLWAEAELCALTGDLLGLKRTVEAISELADKFPGWRPWLGFARAALHRLRGELDAAYAEVETALALALPGEHRAFVRLGPARAELLLLQGDAEGALRQCEAVLREVERCSLDRWAAVEVERIRALAHSARHEHEMARASMARAFTLAHEQGYGGLPLALLYAAQARVTLAARVRDECSAALASMRGLIELADAPALVGAYEGLREDVGRDLQLGDLPPAPSVRPAHSAGSTVYSEIRTRMSTCSEGPERARQALDLLLEDSAASAGQLFLFDASGLFSAASTDGFANEGQLALARKYVATQRDETKTATMTVVLAAGEALGAPSLLAEDGSKLVPVLLSDVIDGRSVLLGLGLLAMQGASLRMPRSALVHAIAGCLASAGDSVPLAIDD